MNTVDALSRLKSGLMAPHNFRKLQATKRVLKLRLSVCCDVESVHQAGINSVDLDSVEKRYLLSGSADGCIHVHDLYNQSSSQQYTSKCICKIDRTSRSCHKYSVECVQWYPTDTGLFISSGMDRNLRIWDANSLQPAENFIMASKIYHHHMSPISSHNLVAVATQSNEVILADLRSGSKSHELRGHERSVLTVQWSPRHEFHLASGSMDNRLLIWDIRRARNCLFSMDQHNGRNCAELEQSTAHNGYVHGLTFAAGGLLLLSVGTDGRMRLWNSDTGRNEMVNYGRISMASKKGLRFTVSSDTEPQMIFVPSQGNILVYELSTGIKRNTLLGHYNTVTCCIYSENTQSLYSGANDRSILVWESELDVPRGETQPMAASSVSHSLLPRRPITEDAWSSDEG